MQFLNEKYSVEMNHKLSKEDHEVLLNLYQPIIGSSSISLYNTLVFENMWNKKIAGAIFSVERIAKMTSSSHKQLIKNLAKLTQIKLLKVYKQKTSDNIIFALNKPLSARLFLNNHSTKLLLKERIGQENYEALTFYFKEKKNMINEKDYIDMENFFLEEIEPIFENMHIEVANNSKVDVYLCEKEFDLKWIEEELIKASILCEIKETEKINIDSLLMIRKTTKEEILLLIKTHFKQGSRQIDWTSLRLEYSKRISPQTFETKIKEEANILSKNDFLVIASMNSLEWVNYYEECVGEKPCEITYLSVNKLKNKFNFSNGIINCLISYSYFKNDKAFVYNYVAKIANSIAEKKLVSTKDVYLFLKTMTNRVTKVKKVNESYVDKNSFVLDETINIEW